MVVGEVKVSGGHDPMLGSLIVQTRGTVSISFKRKRWRDQIQQLAWLPICKMSSEL